MSRWSIAVPASFSSLIGLKRRAPGVRAKNAQDRLLGKISALGPWEMLYPET